MRGNTFMICMERWVFLGPHAQKHAWPVHARRSKSITSGSHNCVAKTKKTRQNDAGEPAPEDFEICKRCSFLKSPQQGIEPWSPAAYHRGINDKRKS